jgi:hypothetical protein
MIQLCCGKGSITVPIYCVTLFERLTLQKKVNMEGECRQGCEVESNEADNCLHTEKLCPHSHLTHGEEASSGRHWPRLGA